jgi:centromere protein B
MDTAKQKRKRQALTIEQKVELIREADKHRRHVDIAAEFGIPQSTLSNIIAKRVQILSEWESGNAARKSLKTPKFADVDSALARWFADKRANDVPLTHTILCQKAQEFATALGVTVFHASSGYIDRFKKRHNIVSAKTRQCSVKSATASARSSFL